VRLGSALDSSENQAVRAVGSENRLRTNEPVLLPKVTFGKYRGQNWTDVPPDYLQWILRQQDMNEDVVHTARHHLDKNNPSLD
jgi:hypothetical protein